MGPGFSGSSGVGARGLDAASGQVALRRGRDFARRGYPRWWGGFAAGLEMMSAVLMALPVSRIVDLALGAVIIVAAVLTVLRHRDFTHLVPLGVFVEPNAQHSFDNS